MLLTISATGIQSERRHISESCGVPELELSFQMTDFDFQMNKHQKFSVTGYGLLVVSCLAHSSHSLNSS